MKNFNVNLKLFLTAVTILTSANLLSAQLVIYENSFTAGSVSNGGKVSGYVVQHGPYYIWTPDSANAIVNIGGVAPGQGVGGQARFSTDGSLLSGTSNGINGPEMSMYSVAIGQWTTLGSLGVQVGGNVSAGYNISGDGKTVVGLAWSDSTCGSAHGVAWNATEGMMDLGSLFASNCRNTRADAVNSDGSVIVGWQDFDGAWKSAVWRKNPDGGYFPNEYILLDTTGNPTDEYNQMGEASTVSADGKWIGGYGDFANNNQPWIWCKDSGVINLGSLPNVGNGNVSGISDDGTVVSGWFDAEFFGGVRTPFLWTRDGGLIDLNAYLHTAYLSPTDKHVAYLAQCLSPDGHYIAGYGVNGGMNYFAFRLRIGLTTSVKEKPAAAPINIYPNPATDLATIENQGKAMLTVTGMLGNVIDRTEINGKHTLNISNYAPGVYTVSVQSGDVISTQKLVKN